ncbi:MAG: hypothetical protein QW315_07450 [Candidatus Hadarchaeum sp.]
MAGDGSPQQLATYAARCIENEISMTTPSMARRPSQVGGGVLRYLSKIIGLKDLKRPNFAGF